MILVAIWGKAIAKIPKVQASTSANDLQVDDVFVKLRKIKRPGLEIFYCKCWGISCDLCVNNIDLDITLR